MTIVNAAVFAYVNICIFKYSYMKQYSEQIKYSAEIIRSLGHPARVEILILLRKKPKMKMTVTQIQKELDLTQPETSRHLLVLKNSEVLLCEKDGASSYYFINAEDAIVSGIARCMSLCNTNFGPAK